jgi:hypothetical protein
MQSMAYARPRRRGLGPPPWLLDRIPGATWCGLPPPKHRSGQANVLTMDEAVDHPEWQDRACQRGSLALARIISAEP